MTTLDLEVTVDETGHVKHLALHPDQVRALQRAMLALSRRRYAPLLVNGQARAFRLTMAVSLPVISDRVATGAAD